MCNYQTSALIACELPSLLPEGPDPYPIPYLSMAQIPYFTFLSLKLSCGGCSPIYEIKFDFRLKFLATSQFDS